MADEPEIELVRLESPPIDKSEEEKPGKCKSKSPGISVCQGSAVI